MGPMDTPVPTAGGRHKMRKCNVQNTQVLFPISRICRCRVDTNTTYFPSSTTSSLRLMDPTACILK